MASTISAVIASPSAYAASFSASRASSIAMIPDLRTSERSTITRSTTERAIAGDTLAPQRRTSLTKCSTNHLVRSPRLALGSGP